MYRRTKNSKIVIFYQKLLKIVTKMVIKFPSKTLIASLLTYSWTGGKGSFEQVKWSFRVFFMKTEQASINFDTDCSYYENTLEELLFFICPLNGAERGEKRAVTC